MFERSATLLLAVSLVHACSSKDETHLTQAGANSAASAAPASAQAPWNSLPSSAPLGAAGAWAPSSGSVGRVASLARSSRVPSFMWADRRAPSSGRSAGLSRAQLGPRPSAERAARTHLTDVARYYRMSPAQVSSL